MESWYLPDFLPKWIIFFHFRSWWLNDLYITQNRVFCSHFWQKLGFSILNQQKDNLKVLFLIKSSCYIVPNPSNTLYFIQVYKILTEISFFYRHLLRSTQVTIAPLAIGFGVWDANVASMDLRSRSIFLPSITSFPNPILKSIPLILLSPDLSLLCLISWSQLLFRQNYDRVLFGILALICKIPTASEFRRKRYYYVLYLDPLILHWINSKIAAFWNHVQTVLLQTCDLKRSTMIFNYNCGIYVVVNLIE